MSILCGLQNPAELARLLCGQIELWMAVGEQELALGDIVEAEALAASVYAGPTSELGQGIAERRVALGLGRGGRGGGSGEGPASTLGRHFGPGWPKEFDGAAR